MIYYRKSKVWTQNPQDSALSEPPNSFMNDGGRSPMQIGSQWSEGELAPIVNMINDRLSRLLTVREKDDSNLVLMFDILFRFLAVDYGKRAD